MIDLPVDKYINIAILASVRRGKHDVFSGRFIEPLLFFSQGLMHFNFMDVYYVFKRFTIAAKGSCYS